MSKVRSSNVEGADGGGEPALRIGEVARRAGIPAATLRAWERRYGVVSPVRGDSGYRLYSARDERTLRQMAELVEGGLAPAEAANRLRSDSEADPSARAADDVAVSDLREELALALSKFDDRRADRLLDRAVTVLSIDALLEQILLPVLRELESGSIGQEHFASNLVRGRMLALARGWGGGGGRRALLACPGDEHHDIGLIAFGLALKDRGWRIAFLGANTPIDSLSATAAATAPAAIILYSMHPELYGGWESDLKRLSSDAALMLCGPGADDQLCSRLGATHLSGGPVEEAMALV